MAGDTESTSDSSVGVAESSAKTNVNVFKGNHRWTIKNFIQRWTEPGAQLHSGIFGSEIHDTVRWRLTLYRRSEDNMALYLKHVSPLHGRVLVRLKFWILNYKGDKMNFWETNEPAALWDNQIVGCNTYASLKYLSDTKNGLLPDKNLTIYCEIDAFEDIASPGRCVENGSAEEDLIELSYTWVINDFSLHRRDEIRSIESPVFFSPKSRKLKWKLSLVSVDRMNRDTTISLSLLTVIENDIKCTVRLSLINPKLKGNNRSQLSISIVADHRSGVRCSIWKFPWADTDTFLRDDKLTIICEIVHSAKHDNDITENVITIPAIPTCRLLDDFEPLFATKKFSDVTLVVGERELQAHKTLLVARSSVFSAMFEHRMKEQEFNRVEITDIEYEVLDKMLDFIYTGKANDVTDMALDLLKAADKYDLQGLKVICERELSANITVENAAVLLEVAHVYNTERLKSAVIAFIGRERVAVWSSEAFRSMVEPHPLLCELFHRLSVLE